MIRGNNNMKSYRKELTFNTKSRRAYVNITPQVEDALAESGMRNKRVRIKIIGE